MSCTFTDLLDYIDFNEGCILEDSALSFLRPTPKLGKDHCKLNGYRILTVQNTIVGLMKCVIARKFARDLEGRERLLANHGDLRLEKCAWGNTAAFAYYISMKNCRGKNKHWLWQLI